MAYINTILEDRAPEDVKKIYDKSIETLGYISNYTKVFSLRPQVMEAWNNLIASIRRNMDTRRFELVTLAAARALKSSYCMLAHGSILRNKFYSDEQLNSIARDYHSADLTPAEIAMMAFAEQIVKNATAINQNHINELRQHGLSDAEIFDIAATATARCFFSKTLDALGAEPDVKYLELEENLRKTLTVGRPISGEVEE
jgi:uncharacterized peroxidase-related enzyme